MCCGYSSRAPIIQKTFFQSKFCGHYSRAAPIRERPLLARVRYSPPFYTAPQLGYKMCLRCSVKNGFLEIFVHFMPGEDDDLLDWPFSGQFHLRLKNFGQEQENDLVEKISSQPKMEAFKCPSPESLRNKIGFGLQELISIDKVKNRGFWNSSRDEVVVIARIAVAHKYQ